MAKRRAEPVARELLLEERLARAAYLLLQVRAQVIGFGTVVSKVLRAEIEAFLQEDPP